MATSLTPEEIQAAFDEFNQAFIAAGMDINKVNKQVVESYRDAQAGVKNYTYQLNLSLKQLGSSMLNLGESLKDGKQGAGVYNDSLKAGADAIDAFASKFGILGKIFGALVTAGAKYAIEVNKQSDKLFETYQALSRFGAAGAEGMQGVFKSMQDFGLNVEQLGDYTNLLKNNSEAMAQFGLTVNQGRDAFTGVARGIQRSNLQTEFLRLGMTVPQINEGIAGYIALQSRLGATQNKTQAQLTQGAAEYLRQQDLLTKLTGKNAEAIENEEKARQSDQQYRAIQRDLEKQARAGDKAAEDKLNEIRKAMAQLGPEGQKALKQALTGFVGAGKEGEKLFRTSARGFAYATDPFFKASKFMDMIAEDAPKVMDAFGGKGGLAGLGLYNETFLDFAETADIEIGRAHV